MRRNPVARCLLLHCLTLCLTLPVAVAVAATGPPADEDGTARMVARLETVRAELSPRDVWNAVQRLEALGAAPVPDDPAARAGRELETALLQLLAGDTAAAVERLEALDRTPAGEALGTELDAARGLAWLRLGEIENCIDGHNPESCLLPIRGAGVHTVRRGSQRAAEIFAAVLERDPDDLVSRWLLNLAHQTLGSYPHGVAERWLVPPAVFRSRAELPRFRDVAPAAGVAVNGHAGGGVLEDFDGDGLLDLLVSSYLPHDPLRLLRNAGDGTFQDRTADAGLTGLTGGLNLVHADYDNDGDRDVLVLRGAWRGPFGRWPNSLLRNDGAGNFTDVTEAAGVLSAHPTQTAAWADFDLDGYLDLFIGNETLPPMEGLPPSVHPCELYRNRGDGTFEEVAAEVGAAVVGFVKGVTWGDADGDGRPDLYLSRMGQPNLLLRNEVVEEPLVAADAGEAGEAERAGEPVRRVRFRDVTAEAGVAAPAFSFPTWFFDADADGDLDLFVVGYGPRAEGVGEMDRNVISPRIFRRFLAMVVADVLGLPSPGETPRLYLNAGDGTFRDATADAGLDRVIFAMGANHGHLDGDGLPDLYLGTGDPSLASLTPNRALLNAADGRFRDVTTAAGLGHVQKGHAVSFGDVDHDGDQDVHLVVGGAFEGDVYPNALFENPGRPAAWLKLDLVGTVSNRDAIGAGVRVELRTAAGGTLTLRDRVSSGGSFGASPLRRELSLPAGATVETVHVHWPSGLQQTWHGLAPNTLHRLTEGRPQSEPHPLPAFTFPSTRQPTPHPHPHP